MIYTEITKIPYPFLKDAVAKISKDFEVMQVRMDPKGEIYVKVAGQLDEKEVKAIQCLLTPEKHKAQMNEDPVYNIDYDYSSTGEATYVYSLDGIDYRTL